MSNPYSARANSAKRRELSQASRRLSKNPLTTLKRLVTNAGIAREAYFQSFGGGFLAKKNFWTAIQAKYSSNAPFAVDEASQLWSSSLANKGMISTWALTKQFTTEDYTASGQKAGNFLADKVRYGFSFHYNPTTVGMSYGFMPGVDPTMYTSGLEGFNDLSGGLGNSTVTFNLVINRLHDMQYFDPKTGYIESKYGAGSFAGRKPDRAEQRDIWNKGTMYDIEFLLRAIVGFTIDSSLGRNTFWDKKTADIGFLTGLPVELHLGKSLRYIGRIENLNINHVLFTERMVPTFSEVTITVQRIPDYAGNTLLYPVDGDIDKAATTNNGYSAYGTLPGVQGATSGKAGFNLDDFKNARPFG
jgi:hypothetical protein